MLLGTVLGPVLDTLAGGFLVARVEDDVVPTFDAVDNLEAAGTSVFTATFFGADSLSKADLGAGFFFLSSFFSSSSSVCKV